MRIERASTPVLAVSCTLVAATLAALLWAALAAGREAPAQTRALVRSLTLTDPALFNEARYTRNPSQADRFAAFQDGPNSFEHFPTGSLIPPPPATGRAGEP